MRCSPEASSADIKSSSARVRQAGASRSSSHAVAVVASCSNEGRCIQCGVSGCHSRSMPRVVGGP
eukprot:7249872-Prymnesium_polylepis.1